MEEEEKTNNEEGSDARRMEERLKIEGEIEENIEKLDKIIERLKREEKIKREREEEWRSGEEKRKETGRRE